MRRRHPRGGWKMAKQITGPEFYKDVKKKWRWRVRANNGKIIADSGQGYATRYACVSGFLSVVSVDQKSVDAILARNGYIRTEMGLKYHPGKCLDVMFQHPDETPEEAARRKKEAFNRYDKG
jgi:uncharacterized protein YegP (UPF0339 family)